MSYTDYFDGKFVSIIAKLIQQVKYAELLKCKEAPDA